MKIREVTGKDKSEWISLRAQLWPRYDPDQLRDEVDKMLQDSNWGIFVAEHEGKIVGFIECSIRDKAPQTGSDTSRDGMWYLSFDGRALEVCWCNLVRGGQDRRAAPRWPRIRVPTIL